MAEKAYEASVGGFLLEIDDNTWTFIWFGNYMDIHYLEFGWSVKIEGENIIFDSLSEALMGASTISMWNMYEQ